jgi:hypothetical protein
VQVQDPAVPCYIILFLRIKREAGTAKQTFMNCDWRYAYANVCVVFAEGLDMLTLGPIATGR